jgi:hypothetical protein
MPAVVAKLKGGLGNQLFQYAVARAISVAENKRLLFDTGYFNLDYKRQYMLDRFHIPQRFIGGKESMLLRFSLDPRRQILRRLAKTVAPGFVFNVIHDRECGFQPDVFGHRESLWLEGYWQSETYFQNATEVVTRELRPGAPVTGPASAMLEDIQRSLSVCVHVRRGDYAADPEVNRIHGLCQPEYYDRAARYILSLLCDPVFFVFSDDFAWVRQNIRLPGKCILADFGGSQSDLCDFELMRACKHFVLANSSFSWWAAWLAESPNKIAVAPQKWFADPRLSLVDPVPKSWVRM